MSAHRGSPAAVPSPGHRQPGAIPHTLSEYRCIDFVNSRFADHTGGGAVHDRLELEEWRRWFAARCGLDIRRPFSDTVRRDLIELRTVMRRLLESRAEPDARTARRLDRWVSRPVASYRVLRSPEGLELRLRWREDDWASLAATVVASYVELVSTGGIAQVRVCANPSCTYVFHDDTRNRSRRWCDVAVCGNLVRVRRHRSAAGGAA